MGDSEQFGATVPGTPPDATGGSSGDAAQGGGSTEAPPATGATGPGAPEGEDIGCAEMGVAPDRGPICVGREVVQQVVVSCSTSDEMRTWPRRVVARDNPAYLQWQRTPEEERPARAPSRYLLYIYHPNRSGPARLESLGPDQYDAYLRCTGRPNPDIRDASTWGPREEFDLPVCTIEGDQPGRRRLVFDPNSREARWTFHVYNAAPEGTRWRRFLKRTLMGLPLQHLQFTGLKSVFIDFFVSNGAFGRGATNDVMIGGAYCSRPEIGDPSEIPVVCLTFAALNRIWGEPAIQTLPPDGGINSAYDDLSQSAYTIYHEFGHVYHTAHPPPGTPALERRGHAVTVRRSLQQTLIDYSISIGYGGRSQGYMEGFAEVYRKRLQGTSLGGSAAIQRTLESTLNEAMMPTQSSAREAQLAIAGHARTLPDE